MPGAKGDSAAATLALGVPKVPLAKLPMANGRRFGTSPSGTQSTPHLDQFEIQLGKHGTLQRMMFFLRVAKGAVEPPTKRAAPTSQDAGGIVCHQPLPGGAMLLTFAVGESCRCSRRSRSGGGVDQFAICANGDKPVYEFCVGNHRIDQCHQEVFLFRHKLIEEVLTA